MQPERWNRYLGSLLELALQGDDNSYEVGAGLEFGIIDVLHHARHLCDTHGFDFAMLDEDAEWHYRTNLDPEEFDAGLWAMCRRHARTVRARLIGVEGGDARVPIKYVGSK